MNITPRLNKALHVAAWAHRNQTRKGGDIPYIVHPFAVMTIAATATENEDVLIACLFHDIIEDVPEEYSREQMLTEFGERVVKIVDGVTKNDNIAEWQARSEAYLAHLEHDASDESVLVSCADKLHNLRCTLDDYAVVGSKLWGRFNVGAERQVWWYQEVQKVIQKRLPELSLNKDLGDLVQELQAATH